MISPKHIFAWATAAITGALMAASFQTPAMAGEGPERADDSFRYDAPITRPIAAPVAGYELITGPTVTVAGFQSADGDATCPAGKRVLGGGWVQTGDLEVTSARAIADGAVWRVTFSNTSASPALTANATAQCAFTRPSAQSD
uniref:hypothetical protein n=1 Tax=Nonomuraea bangladeshensis TaxID=404385 RepID=UPI003F49B241